MVGWASPALPLLSSEKDPILETGAITTEESSWIGSVFNLGCVLGTLSFGYVVAMIGSKQAMYYISIPSMVRLSFSSFFLFITFIIEFSFFSDCL